MPTSQAFLQLDKRIQHYLWAERWESLREAQEQAIPLILAADRDVVIASNTASGKTEAAFLPALTHMLQQTQPGLIVYVSPLKALINDQFERLGRLCKSLGIPVWPWHGDVTSTMKQKFMNSRDGVLLITPESLEATLCRRGTRVARLFEHVAFFIVDELHAFIGNERGKQLQSLLHRIEIILGRRVPRIGLSATLGDVGLASGFLRGDGKAAIVSVPSDGRQLRVLIKGFEKPSATGNPADDAVNRAKVAVAKHLFRALHGSNNLVFPNRRSDVEEYTHLLNRLCDQAGVPQEFWPHHGSLSKTIREETELALKQHERPATIVCTSTLELGIDIGAVKSIAQIGPPPSVSSLLQRLGRSGRRKGESAILRGYVIEADGENDLRLLTVQTVAMVSLLLEHWVEPPAVRGLHYSTLIQQLLSCIAQYGGLMPAQAYMLLCGPEAPFAAVSQTDFAELLKVLGKQEILTQDHSGLLLHGIAGDKIVNDYHFYAAFKTEEEFSVVTGEKTLGTLQIPPYPKVHILMAGRTWLVEKVDRMRKLVYVTPASDGHVKWDAAKPSVSTKVRQRMRELYQSSGAVPFLDKVAQQFLVDGRRTFKDMGLGDRLFCDRGENVLLLTWLGDFANRALACILHVHGLPALVGKLGVSINRSAGDADQITSALVDIASAPVPTVDELLADTAVPCIQKWDELLSPHLLRATYASSNLAIDEAISWLQGKFVSRSPSTKVRVGTPD